MGLETEAKKYDIEQNRTLIKATGCDRHQTNMCDNNQTIHDNLLHTLPKHMTMVCAFPGKTLHDHMWEYLSLWALHDQHRSDVIPTISLKTSNRLKRLLKTINMNVINEIKESDYDLAYARILGHSTPILPLETIESKRIPLLLEKFTKRYIEIINADVINRRQFVMFNGETTRDMYTEMSNIKARYGFNRTDDSLHWVGLYIGSNSNVSKILL